MTEEIKNIKIKGATWQRLNAARRLRQEARNETIDEVINRALDALEGL